MKQRYSGFYCMLTVSILSIFIGCSSGGGNSAPPPASGRAKLTWNAPTTNSSGGTLNSITGYYVYHGTSSGVYPEKTSVGNVTTYQVTGLASGTHYFAVSAYNNAGEGPKSSEGKKTIP